MVGDGIIVESKVSFKITWDNPGNNKQPIWNQNKQEVIIHESDIYPDLMYTNMFGLSTYYKYTNIDSLLNLIKRINSYIDNKIAVSENSNKSIKSIANKEYPIANKEYPIANKEYPIANKEYPIANKEYPIANKEYPIANKEYPIATKTSNVPSVQNRGGVPSVQNRGGVPSVQNRGGVPSVQNRGGVPSLPNQLIHKDEITNEPQPINSPDASNELSESSKYKVIVYGKELNFIDAQSNNESIEVKHFVSKNLYRKINNETIDNTEKIWIEIITKSKTYKFQMSEFGQTEDGVNLLVEILPTIQLTITPNENNNITKNTEIDDDIYFNELSKIKNSDIEKERYRKSKEETEKMAKMAKSIK